jgi:hypothetical protein
MLTPNSRATTATYTKAWTAKPRIGEHADAMARLRKPDRQRMGGEPDAPTGGHPQEPLARGAV